MHSLEIKDLIKNKKYNISHHTQRWKFNDPTPWAFEYIIDELMDELLIFCISVVDQIGPQYTFCPHTLFL